MAAKIQIRMGGYGPATTCFSKALKFIGGRLESEFGDSVDIKYVWNIMDFGYRSEDILWLVESGILSLGYQSSSYLTDRVPELGIADLPFLFSDKTKARAAIDGEMGAFLARKIEERVGYRILGWFENGFRHVSNKVKPIHTPADMTGMTIRVLPSKVQARTFELMGAKPLRWDLTEALQAIFAGTIDAQENPLANTVTYGAHKYHRFHTLTGHFYVSRPIFLHRTSYDGWPDALRRAMQHAVKDAVLFQRKLAIGEEEEALAAIRAQGCEVVELSAAEHAQFVTAVQPLLAEARNVYAQDALRFVSS
ncbi:MAG: TRAP transporter substrate-binding protein [Pseudorhodoplanes sp.]|jgi:tripartite ATP-independent transporter DctP family solute receptor|nr:TRAP transporter substrate-binding protein [Pseudorhodoplanes sp.]